MQKYRNGIEKIRREKGKKQRKERGNIISCELKEQKNKGKNKGEDKEEAMKINYYMNKQQEWEGQNLKRKREKTRKGVVELQEGKRGE